MCSVVTLPRSISPPVSARDLLARPDYMVASDWERARGSSGPVRMSGGTRPTMFASRPEEGHPKARLGWSQRTHPEGNKGQAQSHGARGHACQDHQHKGQAQCQKLVTSCPSNPPTPPTNPTPVCKYASMQICKYASMQVCMYMQVCKYESMQVCLNCALCKVRGKLIVCSLCDIFY